MDKGVDSFSHFVRRRAHIPVSCEFLDTVILLPAGKKRSCQELRIWNYTRLRFEKIQNPIKGTIKVEVECCKEFVSYGPP